MTLALALGWKYDNAPGIETIDGVLTAWPEALGDAPDETEQAAIIAEYAAFLALPAEPYLNNGGLARFTGASPVSTLETIKMSAVARISKGRYRVFHEDPYPTDQYSVIPAVFDANPRTIRITARTTAYVEVRVTDLAGAVQDPQEVTVKTERVVT